MRILIVSQYFWPENFRINDLVDELIARGHEVTVLTGVPNYPEGEVFPEFCSDPAAYSHFRGARVVRVPLRPRGTTKVNLALNYLSFVVSGILYGPLLLRDREFDVIFVFQTSPVTSALPALWLRALRRIPVVLWVLDSWPETLEAIGVTRSRLALGLVERLVRFIYRRCALVLAQSRAFEPVIAARAGGADRVAYFPGWPEPIFLDADRPDPAPEMSRMEGDFKVLFAGNLGQAQDLPALIEAADMLRDIPRLRWVVVGSGRAMESAREDVAKRGLTEKVVFLGRFPLERMPEFFVAADALLVSLVAEPIWTLTIPGKVQSYLAAGKPILAMLDGEGARVVREAEAGLVASAGDSAALAANVLALKALEPADRAAMGRRGQAYAAQEFSRVALIDALEGHFRQLTGG